MIGSLPAVCISAIITINLLSYKTKQVIGCYFCNDILISIREKSTRLLFEKALNGHSCSHMPKFLSQSKVDINIVCCLGVRRNSSDDFCCILYAVWPPFFFFQLVNEVLKFKIVETSVSLAKDLKNSLFLSQIYFLLSYLLFLSSSCLLFCFLFFNNTWYIFCSPHSLYVLSYITRKPIVYKPPASSWASLSLPPFVVYCI